MKHGRPHIVLSGGGTGGHLFPGLAVARQLVAARPEVRITFAGSGKPLEREQVAAAGCDYLALRCRPRPRRIVDAWRFLADNLAGYRAARRFLAESDVGVVIGLGGYTSVPMARAAVGRGLPLVLLEQNAIPGRATRWLSRRATVVCIALEAARGYLPSGCRVRLTGNPVLNSVPLLRRSSAGRNCFGVSCRNMRAPCAHVCWQGDWGLGAGGVGVPVFPSPESRAPSPLVAAGSRARKHCFCEAVAHCGEKCRLGRKSNRGDRPRLLVLGGSGGAGPLNQAVPGALARLGSYLRDWRILHQAGHADVEAIRDRYDRLGLEANVVGFIPDMPRVLADADLAVCRAGGTTLAELAVAGVPAVTVPFSRAAEDHQRRNAEVFADGGACLLVDERPSAESLADRLATALSGLLAGPARRAAMSLAMRRLGRPRAAADVAEMVLDLLDADGTSTAVRSAA